MAILLNLVKSHCSRPIDIELSELLVHDKQNKKKVNCHDILFAYFP